MVIKGSEIVAGPMDPAGRTHQPAKSRIPRRSPTCGRSSSARSSSPTPASRAATRTRPAAGSPRSSSRTNRPLQRIGPDPIYKNDEYLKLTTVGRGFDDLIQDSFFFDPADQTLYMKIAGEPGWFCIEVGVRGFVAHRRETVHDVVIRGLEMRHNRQPGGQWPMV